MTRATARQIILQPVVGGPDGQPCPAPAGRGARRGGRVRACWQHAHISNAIAEVVKHCADAEVEVIAGYPRASAPARTTPTRWAT